MHVQRAREARRNAGGGASAVSSFSAGQQQEGSQMRSHVKDNKPECHEMHEMSCKEMFINRVMVYIRYAAQPGALCCSGWGCLHGASIYNGSRNKQNQVLYAYRSDCNSPLIDIERARHAVPSAAFQRARRRRRMALHVARFHVHRRMRSPIYGISARAVLRRKGSNKMARRVQQASRNGERW